MTLIAVLLVALLHGCFFVLESVLWTHPNVRRIFGNSAEQAEATRVMALNQGAYNLGLAVLLLWFHLGGHTTAVVGVLAFIIAMGVVGGLTASRSILLLQTLPAAVALALALLSA